MARRQRSGGATRAGLLGAYASTLNTWESDPAQGAWEVPPAAKPRGPAAGCGRLWRARFAGGDDDGDLAAKAEPGFQPEVVTAPEPAGVIPVRAVAAGQQPHGLVGRGQDLRAVGGLQAGAWCLVPEGRRAAEQPP